MTRRARVGPGPLAALTLGVLLLHAVALRWPLPAPGWGRSASPAGLQVRALPGPSAPSPADATRPGGAPVARATAPPAATPTAPPPAPSAAQPAEPRVEPAATATSEPTPTATAPAAATLLVPGAALWRYEVTARWQGLALAGRAELAWRHDGRQYEAQLLVEVPPAPARRQRSQGQLSDAGLAPLRFSERVRSEEATHFDRAAGRIVFSANRAPAPLADGAQDRLSVLLQLSALAAGDPARLAPGRRVVVPTAGTREADDWEFVVGPQEALRLPGGTVQAVPLTRSPRREYDVKMELWLGPGPDYGPVRLRLTPPNGDWLDLQWSGTDKG